MARLSKEEEAYQKGLRKALDIVKAGGVLGLEKELEFRGITEQEVPPMGVARYELTRMARKYIVPELKVISTAIAYTLEYDMKLPSRTISKFLLGFNKRVDDYRANMSQLTEDKKVLEYDYGLNQQIETWYNMAKEREHLDEYTE